MFTELVPPSPPSMQEVPSVPVLLSSPTSTPPSPFTTWQFKILLSQKLSLLGVFPETTLPLGGFPFSASSLVVNILHRDHDLARIQILCLPKVGNWFNVMPVKALGVHLRDAEYCTAIRYRLCLQIFDYPGPCVTCGKDSDVLRDHDIEYCDSQWERITSHNVLRDILSVCQISTPVSHLGRRYFSSLSGDERTRGQAGNSYSVMAFL